MSIKSGAIIHDIHGFVADRIQTGGATNLNIAEEKIRELGNWQGVETIRDIPDLSYDVESFDVSTEFESLICFIDPTTTTSGSVFDLSNSIPMDIISPFKPRVNAYTVSQGLIIPYLTLESSSYRFGVGTTNATQQHTFRGDSYFYVDGAQYYEEFSGNGVTSTFAFAHTAIPYNYKGVATYAVGACVVYADGSYKRLFINDDFTNTAAHIVILDPATTTPVGSTLRVVYGSATPATYPQVGNTPRGHTVHEGVAVKPGALRGKDIDVYIGTNAATPVFSRWSDVQNFQLDRKVNLDADREFGNPQYVAQDYDIPDVTGSIGVRPRSVTSLFDKVFDVAGVNPGEIAGPLTSQPLPVELRCSDPNTGARLKTFYIPDARFKIPGVQGRVNQKTEVSFEFSSDSGVMYIYKGNRAGT